MAWLEELAIAEFFRAAGGGAIIADDPRCFPLTHSLSPAPLRGGSTPARLVRRWPGGGGWAERVGSVDKVIASPNAGPILLDLSQGTGVMEGRALPVATLVRQHPSADAPAGFCAASGALASLFMRRDAETRELWTRISAALSAPTCPPADLYDRLQTFVGGHGLVRDISFTERSGPVATLDPVGCMDRLTAGEAYTLLSAAEPRWPEAESVRLCVPRFGSAPFRLRIAGLSRNGEPPCLMAEGEISPVSVSGSGWAFVLTRDGEPGKRWLGIDLTGDGLVVTHLSVCLPPLDTGGSAAADRYDPLSVYASDWWPR